MRSRRDRPAPRHDETLCGVQPCDHAMRLDETRKLLRCVAETAAEVNDAVAF
jgi:hypothetical protein